MDKTLYRLTLAIGYGGEALVIITVLLLSGCAVFRETPPTAELFPLNAAYREIKADPGRVLDERVKLGPTEAGERYGNNIRTICGFVDFARKIVWLSRTYECPDYAVTRRHENCHTIAHESGGEDECHDGRSFERGAE